MTPTQALKAAALATGRMYPDWPAMMEGLTADGYVSFFTDFIAAADPKTILALIERLQVAEDAAKDAGFRWDLFASYLLDKCEGETITEQNLQGWTAEMVQSDWYNERIAS